jgi:hypothetical protein
MEGSNDVEKNAISFCTVQNSTAFLVLIFMLFLSPLASATR